MDHVKASAGIFGLRQAGIFAVLFAVASVVHRVDAAMMPPPLVPEDGSTFGVYVADQETYDSNLYRLPTSLTAVGTVAVPNASRSDLENTVSIGGDGQLTLRRQVVDLYLRADENRFVHNTALNNTSGYGNLVWNWVVGGYFSGQAGMDFTRGLASFDQTRFLGRDLVNTTRYYGTARYQMGPHWALYSGISDSDTVHGARIARFENFQLKSGNGGLEYATNVNDTFALDYRYRRGIYPPADIFSLGGIKFSPDFHDDTAQVVVKYALTDKTQINANAGYLKRQYPNTSIGHFAGDVWRISVSWQPTEKTQVVVAGWHELNAYLVAQSNYFISQGGSVGPIWSPTEKLKFYLTLSYENQNFIPQSTNVLTLGPLNAKVKTEQLQVAYTPRTNWIFNASYSHQQRSSNQVNFVFSDENATLGVLYKFH